MKTKSLSLIALLAALCAGSVIGQAYASEATSLKIGSVVTLRSVNFPNMFLRHRNWVVDLTTVSSELDQKDSTFRIVKGLAGQGVSLEADNYPGHFLRHQDYRLKLAKYENTTLYKRDATFMPRQGLADTNGVSFESENFPGRFLRHRGYNFWLDPKGNDDLFKKDATFMPVAGLAGAQAVPHVQAALVESITMMQTHTGAYKTGTHEHYEYPASNFELICTRKSNATVPKFECRARYVKDITWGGGSVSPKGTWVGPANSADAVWKGNGGKVSGRIPILGEAEFVLYGDGPASGMPDAWMIIKIDLAKKTASQNYNLYTTYDYKYKVVKVNGKPVL